MKKISGISQSELEQEMGNETLLRNLENLVTGQKDDHMTYLL